MRCIIQRVRSASIVVDAETVGQIDRGILALAGFEHADTDREWKWMAEKIANLRIFPDEDGRMNRSVIELGAEADGKIGILSVPNFTVAGDTRKGRRPSFDTAMHPERATVAFDAFVEALRIHIPLVETGVFGADMQIHLVNDGPVTLVLESPARS